MSRFKVGIEDRIGQYERDPLQEKDLWESC